MFFIPRFARYKAILFQYHLRDFKREKNAVCAILFSIIHFYNRVKLNELKQ